MWLPYFLKYYHHWLWAVVEIQSDFNEFIHVNIVAELFQQRLVVIAILIALYKDQTVLWAACITRTGNAEMRTNICRCNKINTKTYNIVEELVYELKLW